MLSEKLDSANELFSIGKYIEANLVFEKIYTNDLSQISLLFEKQPALKYIYKNYLYSLLQAGEFKAVGKLLYEYRALNPDDSFFSNIDEYRRKVIASTHIGPKLSIVVPVYNSGKYLDICIQSIREQTYDDFELIIVNDGSTDDSLEIIEKHASLDDRIKVINNLTPSGNPGTPRNQALKIAKGLYVGFVDSDDWINNYFYERLMELAELDCLDIAFSGGFYNHESSGHVSQRRYSTIGFNDPNSSRFKTHDSFMIWDKVFYRPMLECFHIRLGETKAAVDVPFIFSAYYYCNKIGFDDELLGYNYRRESESSVTVAHRKNSNCEFEFKAFSDVRKWAKFQNAPDYYHSIIGIKVVSSLMYTLKMVGDEYFGDVCDKVKEIFKTIDVGSYKQFCIDNKKWWQFKEFKTVLESSNVEIKAFLDEKAEAAEKARIEKLFAPRFSLEGNADGILFFPCWLVNNPYQRLFYEALNKAFGVKVEGFDIRAFCKELIDRKAGSFKYIHLHWLHNFFSFDDPEVLQNTLEVLSYAKSKGFKIIYTAHNICSHGSENEKLERESRGKMLGYFDYHLAHGNFAKSRLENEYFISSEDITVVPHGTYGDFYGDRIDKGTARRALSLPENGTALLFFGNIKGYKGVFNLLDSFKQLREKYDDLYLVIAGRILDEDLLPQLISETEDSNIVFKPGFIQNEEVSMYFSAADLCILPYEKVLTSGAAMLSLSMHCPILAPSIGVLPEVISDDVGIIFDTFDDMTNKIEAFHLNQDGAANAGSFDVFLEQYSWDNLVKNIKFLGESRRIGS